MRGVKISVPPNKFDAVKDLAFGLGIRSLSHYTVTHLSSDGSANDRVTVEIETSTPLGKTLTEKFLTAPFFDQKDCFISTRQRRSIVSDSGASELTWPWAEPGIDILQELWQFSHLTTSVVFRSVIAGGLVAYGLINQSLLFIISGILFLPMLPVVLGIGFGAALKQWRLVATAGLTFGVCVALLLASGSVVGVILGGPLRFDEFVSLPVSAVVSIGVGIAAALANSDDAGRREMIGLAATSQIAIIPVWIGACLVLGPPISSPNGELWLRVTHFVINIILILASSTATYFFIGACSPGLSKLRS